MVSGSVLSLMKMRLGTITRVLKSALITLSDKTEIGGCVMKTGRPTTTESTCAKFSQAPGPSSRLPVNGKVTQMVVPTPTSTWTSKSHRRSKSHQLTWTPATAGSTTPSSAYPLQNALSALSVSCKKTSTSASAQSSLSISSS